MNNENLVLNSLEMIEQYITEKLTIENIAESIYFSKFYYSRLFREIMGDSVMEYVAKRKLTLAGRELLETNNTILDIALKFGYNSHEGFTRSFKAYMGITPSDYRKYNLSAISQKTIKEKQIMNYSKSTDEIIRELNAFIVNARQTASFARANEVPVYSLFWNIIADNTDILADKVSSILNNITVINERPDEITNRFEIIRVIEDIAFQSNLLAFNVGLMVSRGQPEDIIIQQPLCENYSALASACLLKVELITRYFNDLFSLIIEDMKKEAGKKLKNLIQQGEYTVDSISGYEYIKYEIAIIVKELGETAVDSITVSLLENYLFRLNIISFAAKMDTFRNPKDKALFDSIDAFSEKFSETINFFKTLIKPFKNNDLANSMNKQFLDIAYQGNILLFYVRGEISHEKLGNLINSTQKATFSEICNKIDIFINYTLQSKDDYDYKKIADMLYEIYENLASESKKLAEFGGPIKFLADKFKELFGRVEKHNNDEARHF